MSDDAILVVDDDESLRDLIRLFLEPTGVEVVEAASCTEGMAALRTHRDRVRLVLLDYFMPGMEPASCAGAMRNLVDTTMIVLCTAAADPAARAAEIGLSRWLAKPFSLDALETLVREARNQFAPDDALPGSNPGRPTNPRR